MKGDILGSNKVFVHCVLLRVLYSLTFPSGILRYGEIFGTR